MPAKNFHVRQAAVSALRAWAKGHDYAESLVERHAQRRMLSSADRALLQAILFGVLRHRRVLDHWIGKLRKGAPKNDKGHVGRELEWFRFTSEIPALVDVFAEIYGAEPASFEITLPSGLPAANWSAWCEEWN
jgi:hypothetical protein